VILFDDLETMWSWVSRACEFVIVKVLLLVLSHWSKVLVLMSRSELIVLVLVLR